MIQVVILTEEQKNQLIGQQYAPDSYFNPIQDLDNNWIISLEETQENVNPDTMWVKELPLIEFKPKPFQKELKRLKGE
jgi:hypothetical protein